MAMTVEQFISGLTSQISRGLPKEHPDVEVHIDFKASPGRGDMGTAETVVMAGEASVSFSIEIGGLAKEGGD